jgi:hypothetical protein
VATPRWVGSTPAPLRHRELDVTEAEKSTPLPGAAPSLLLSVFHPDMVWAWPASYTSVDPVDWQLAIGRFNELRWGSLYAELFRTHTLIHNRRDTIKIELSAEGDGGMAIVDVDNTDGEAYSPKCRPYAPCNSAAKRLEAPVAHTIALPIRHDPSALRGRARLADGGRSRPPARWSC